MIKTKKKVQKMWQLRCSGYFLFILQIENVPNFYFFVNLT